MKKSIFVLTIIFSTLVIVGLCRANSAAACEAQVCGNGIKESGEQCDDGNKNDTDVCSNKCEKQIIKEVVKEVPVEKIVEKEVPVEKIVTVEKIVEVPVEKIIKEKETIYKKKIVYKEKHDKNKKEPSTEKKTLPKTGLPLIGLIAVALGTTGAYGAYRKLKK